VQWNTLLCIAVICALRARIRPHFLFNTLNSIASLIAVQPERAERAIEDVAELFHAALKTDQREGSFSAGPDGRRYRASLRLPVPQGEAGVR